MLKIFKKRLFKSGTWKREKEPGSGLLLESCDTESYSSVNNVTSLEKGSSPNQPDVSTPVWKAVVNIVNFIQGLGFLALPYAVKQGGIAVIVAFFVIPVCLWYTGKVLIECLYDEDEKQGRVKMRSTFKDLGEILEPKYGGYVVTALLNVELFLGSVSYLVACGSLMRHALPMVPLTVIGWTCIAGVAVFPTTFLKSLSEIAWLSILGVIALTSVLISVLWYGAEHVDAWNLESILFWNSEGVSVGVPILVFSYSCGFILPSVEESMREKHKFSLALALSFVTSIVMKITFAVFGFLSFGSNTDQVILNNLPEGPFRMKHVLK